MKFFVHTVEDYSEKANRLTISFLDLPEEMHVPTDFQFKIFAPKSLKFTANAENEVPYWIANGIWSGLNFHYIMKDLKKFARKGAKRGMKDAAESDAAKKFLKAMELNVEVKPVYEEKGNWVGTTGETFIGAFKVIKCISQHSGTYTGIWSHNGHGWEHPSYERCTWILHDEVGNEFILSSSNDYLNNDLDKALKDQKFFTLKGTIGDHRQYHGVKQTKFYARKQEVKYIE